MGRILSVELILAAFRQLQQQDNDADASPNMDGIKDGDLVCDRSASWLCEQGFAEHYLGVTSLTSKGRRASVIDVQRVIEEQPRGARWFWNMIAASLFVIGILIVLTTPLDSSGLIVGTNCILTGIILMLLDAILEEMHRADGDGG